MQISGAQLIGNKKSKEGSQTFHAVNPATGDILEVDFHEATPAEVDEAVKLAKAAFESYKNISNQERASFLDKIADNIMSLGDALIERCQQETALPAGRLQGERGRTVNQLRLFAEVVREGSWVDARIDLAKPDRQPLPKADIRHMLRPLGPVAVFGASNFPLAFSVAGGDTASALAAGCPVVVKGHPAHPGTSELVASAIVKAVKDCDMPEGTFSMVQGMSHETGGALVSHDAITAVGFTGSFRGGKALFDLANRRHVPIPVFAEMGSTNPVFILPEAMAERGEDLGKGLASSITLGTGQFCTNPGLVFLSESAKSGNFKTALSEAINGEAGTMLTQGIKNAYEQGVSKIAGKESVETLASGVKSETEFAVGSKVFCTSIENFEKNPDLAEEVFGPSSVLVQAETKESILKAARALEGHLTATVHGTEADLQEFAELFEILEEKVGRIIINGFPTGVEVCHSMVHGGPYPATTAPQSTSVGTNAIKRFARPVCYQNFPTHLLPSSLQNRNPNSIWRLIDGSMTKRPVEDL